MTRARKYTPQEEVANSLSHALGILLGLIAGYFLLVKAYATSDSWAIWSIYIYLFGMLSSYISSTWYHAEQDVKRKKILQKFDHAAIYLHIAGTYTPLLLMTLRNEGMWGWGLFTFVWVFAIVGVIASFRKLDEHSYVETICYVVMGCSILVAFKPLFDVLSATGKLEVLYWVIAGGVSYIVGAVFYSLAKVKYMHTVFHFFVLGGSICHIIAIYYVL